MVRATLYVGTALVVLACGGESERSDPDACNDAASMKKQILDEAAKLGVTAPCEQPDGSPTYAHFAPACEMYEAKRAECCEAGPAQC